MLLDLYGQILKLVDVRDMLPPLKGLCGKSHQVALCLLLAQLRPIVIIEDSFSCEVAGRLRIIYSCGILTEALSIRTGKPVSAFGEWARSGSQTR